MESFAQVKCERLHLVFCLSGNWGENLHLNLWKGCNKVVHWGFVFLSCKSLKTSQRVRYRTLKKKKNSIHVLVIFMRWYRSWCCTVQHFGNDFIMTSSCFYCNSHFHLDHCGALPYFSEMVGYDGPIYMTHPTKAICPILLVS